jgi:hypothetical protein
MSIPHDPTIRTRSGTPARRRPLPERAEQEAVKKLLLAMGAKFYVAGVTRKKGDYQGTMQTPGLPDLPLVFLPAFKLQPPPAPGTPPLMYELVCIEVKSTAAHKTKHGGLSPFQREAKAYCLGAGVPYVHGDLDAIIGWLIDHGYLKPENVPHYRTG